MIRCWRNLAFVTTAMLSLGISFAVAGPRGGVVVGGEATIGGEGTRNLIVDQWSRRAIINWNTFNIGEGESARFNQPDAQSVMLNRVTGGLGPSEIFGTISANGRVFLINRDGVLFGPNSVVDTAGFLATTSDIKNDDFMSGRYNFHIPGRPDASIVNQGTITAHSAGFAALVAPGVRNSGTITAQFGKIGLAAGNSFSLDFYGDRLITLAVGDTIANQVIDVQTGKPLNALVDNAGALRANGGRVELTAAAARHVVDSVINNRGVIEANRIGKQGGTIVLSAATGASKGAGAPKQTIRLSGKMSATGKRTKTATGGNKKTRSENGISAPSGSDDGEDGQGGTIVVTGEDIHVAGARIDASGPDGGGTVLIGGDWGGGHPQSGLVNHARARLEGETIPTATTVTIDGNTVINASATESGTGGKVIVWSDEKTGFSGTILATGGALGGDGGFVEVSGKHLDFKGTVDLRAPMGTVGTLLLDPLNYYINNSGEAPYYDSEASAIAASTVQSLLQTAHLTITTQPGYGPGDIFVDADITWTGNTTLTLSAYRDININGVTIKNIGAGNLILRADNSGSGFGTVNFDNCDCDPGSVNFLGSTGKVAIYYNPLEGDYTNPRSYSNNVLTNGPNQLTAYMLVNSAEDLNRLKDFASEAPAVLGYTYALGRSFSVDDGDGGFYGFAPGTRFTGIFDGNGGLGESYSISGLSSALFPIIGQTGIVRNLNLTNFDIVATGGNQFLGALAQRNEGTISNVNISNGVIDGDIFTGIIAGGLVGLNLGTITQSSATSVLVAVGDGLTGPNGGFNYAGGLAGINTGTMTGSSADVLVVGGINSFVGGLVGQNGNTGQEGAFGIIQSSSATGTVIGFGSVGGLVGFNAANATITGSQATAVVWTFGNGFAGGLVGQNEGLVSSSSAAGAVFGFGGGLGQFVSLGGLVGTNSSSGQIINSSATGMVTVDAWGDAGGLVGHNRGLITNASASGEVIATGLGTSIGGLVGANEVGGRIEDSQAFGNVTSFADATTRFSFSNAGGLVGRNFGTVVGTSAPSFGQSCSAGWSCATGAVYVGSHGTGGGLIGHNGGTITRSFALGAVTGAQGLPRDAEGDPSTNLGGLAGTNHGTITDSFAAGNVGTAGVAYLSAGGLVGDNSGTILGSFAFGNVWVGDYSSAGGLVGSNGPSDCFNCGGGDGYSNEGRIANSHASGNVTGGAVSLLGGLLGAGEGIVETSSASGAVTGGDDSIIGGLVGGLGAEGAIINSQATGAVTGLGSHASVGGLVGASFGTIMASTASGAVNAGSESFAGGLVGVNFGNIQQSRALASASVSGNGSHSVVGGLVGVNVGTINLSSAEGSVTGGEYNTVGGLVGANIALLGIPPGLTIGGSSFPVGTITESSATGSVSGGAFSHVGGLIGHNGGSISNLTANVNVTGGEHSIVGGLVGVNGGPSLVPRFPGVLETCDDAACVVVREATVSSGPGSIANASASGIVTGGAGSLVGGLVGANPGTIEGSFSTSVVTGGDDSLVGGLVAANLGTISRSFASGASTGGNGSRVGGLAAVNLGLVSQSYATGAATGGANSHVAGLVADNGGTIVETYAVGRVAGGPGSTLGGLIAVNNSDFVVPAFGLAQAAAAGTMQAGTVTFSYWDKQSTGQENSDGGTGLTTAQFNAGLLPGFNPEVWTVNPGQSYPFLKGQPFGTIPPISPIPVIPEPPPEITIPPALVTLPPPTLQVVEARQTDPQPAAEVVTETTQASQSTRSNSGRRGNETTGSVGPLRPDGRPSNVPPLNETRFINNEVVFQICSDVPAQRIQSTMRRLNLSLLSSQSLGLLGCTVFHSRINSGRSVRDTIIALERLRVIDEVTPNYTFELAQDAAAPADAGDPPQYIIGKLRLDEVHRIATGENVRVAVIDSEIDGKHPDLEGAIVARYDAVGPADKPHPHGTGMAGAIVSQRKLKGIAPGARILAIRAFGGASAGAQGTTMQIVQGLDWAIREGAKIVNMSFAGPKDPTLQKAFKAASDKGIVLIAAAGNAGPKSPPLYPGADPNVIAVSATDADDKVYVKANRGKYVAVAAPGVEILVPAPDGNYEFTTGTSVAAAHVSGIAALLLQRDPKLDPAAIREILTSTADPLGAKGRTDELGYGLVDPYRALQAAGAKSAAMPAAGALAAAR